MSPNPDLEAEKLQAEINNLQKESKKIDEEITNLQRARKSPLKDVTWWRDLIGIVSVVGMLFFSSGTFLDQQGEAGRFQITAEVIRLVEKLQAQDPAEREQAAILLVAYGEKALPILLNGLEIAREPEGGPATALAAMARTDSKLVLPELRERARMSYEGVQGRDPTEVQPLINYLVLLGEVGGLRNPEETAELFQEVESGLDCQYLLHPPSETAQEDVAQQPLVAETLQLSEDEKTDRIAVCLHLEEARKSP